MDEKVTPLRDENTTPAIVLERAVKGLELFKDKGLNHVYVVFISGNGDSVEYSTTLHFPELAIISSIAHENVAEAIRRARGE